ncbi:MAG: 3-hydroxyacyl-CoA dehydrogenase NAD-binding domain-containing protein [Candidatus Neomarinimicrobiota bacterium]
MDKKIKIAVIGSGTMGNGIAHISAQSGFKTLLVDINQLQLDDALLTINSNLDRQLKKNIISSNDKNNTINNITISTTINDCKDMDLIIEAIPEKFSIKSSLFKELDAICKKETIFASNTSSISISNLGNQTNRPDKIIGMHFMNPVPIMKLVEVIKTLHTSIDTVKVITSLAKIMGKTPVECNDYPGFISNRILMPMINEAIFCLEQNVAKKEAIDDIMKLGMSHPMGPLQLADFIGLDICLDIMEVLWSGFNDSKYRPCTLLKTMVSSGLLGKKTGRGFYKYD